MFSACLLEVYLQLTARFQPVLAYLPPAYCTSTACILLVCCMAAMRGDPRVHLVWSPSLRLGSSCGMYWSWRVTAMDATHRGQLQGWNELFREEEEERQRQRQALRHAGDEAAGEVPETLLDKITTAGDQFLRHAIISFQPAAPPGQEVHEMTIMEKAVLWRKTIREDFCQLCMECAEQENMLPRMKEILEAALKVFMAEDDKREKKWCSPTFLSSE